LSYFYQATERTAKAFFSSLLKQLLAVLIDTGVPCPAAIRDEIEHAFGLENRQPDLGSLVADIVMPLLATFKEVIVILDGPDICEDVEQRLIWRHLAKMTEENNPRVTIRVAVGSQDHTNVAECLLKTRRLRIDDGSNVQDIETYIDDRISSYTGSGRLFNDGSLQAEVQRLLKQKANGM
jgi:hypothetical protein